MSLAFVSRKASAGQVQCELYSLLREQGLHCEVEYTPAPNMRFDLAIVKNNEIVAIIETKRKTYKSRMNSDKYKETKQYKKYSQFGIPVFYVRGLEEIPKTFKEVMEYYEHL